VLLAGAGGPLAAGVPEGRWPLPEGRWPLPEGRWPRGTGLESVEGTGTTVTVWLPLLDPRQRPSAA
jgi:hypothetical protein